MTQIQNSNSSGEGGTNQTQKSVNIKLSIVIGLTILVGTGIVVALIVF